MTDYLGETSLLALKDVLVLRHMIDFETRRVVLETPLIADFAIRLVQYIKGLFANNDNVIAPRHLVVMVCHVRCLFADVRDPVWSESLFVLLCLLLVKVVVR